MGKYKYALKQELKWLEEEKKILDNILDGSEININNLSESEIRLRRGFVRHSIARIKGWIEDAEENRE